MNWCNNPVTMSITEKQVPISTIPFPMVAVCPEIKIHRKWIFLTPLKRLPQKSWNLSDSEYEKHKKAGFDFRNHVFKNVKSHPRL